MLYERTALSKKPAKLAEIELKVLRDDDQLTPDLFFRDPYFLDFLDLNGAYSEKDLESAVLRALGWTDLDGLTDLLGLRLDLTSSLNSHPMNRVSRNPIHWMADWFVLVSTGWSLRRFDNT